MFDGGSLVKSLRRQTVLLSQTAPIKTEKLQIRSVNRILAPAWGIVLLASTVGLYATGVRSASALAMQVTLLLLLTTVFPISLYLRSTRHRYLYLSLSAIAWCLLSTVGSWFCVTFIERIASATPLADGEFAQIDAHLGIHELAVHMWATKHRLGDFINYGYGLQNWLVISAELLPIFLARVERVQRLNVAFLITLLMSLPVVLMLPGIGPWYLYGFPSSEVQRFLEKSILDFRNSAGTTFLPIGVIVCPSYHVILSLLSAWTLWGIRWLRVPVALVALWIVMSTLTSGMHYFIDVLAGIAVTAAAIALSILITDRWQVGACPHVENLPPHTA